MPAVLGGVPAASRTYFAEPAVASAALAALQARVETAVGLLSLGPPAKLLLASTALAPIAFTRVSASSTIYGFDTHLTAQ